MITKGLQRAILSLLFMTQVLFITSCLNIDKRYQEHLVQIELDKVHFQHLYKTAKTNKAKDIIIKQAEKYLTKLIAKDLFSYWRGTPWDYNGTTEIPRQGAIACGYFVTTLLRDIGFKLERNRLAQQASENIIKSLTTRKYIRRFSNTPIDKFSKAVHKQGEGLYLVGLDTHIGFWVVQENTSTFLHASFSKWGGVKKENPIESKVIINSKYRIVGKILQEKMIINWLTDTKIPTLKK